jgi:hypothetical protein
VSNKRNRRRSGQRVRAEVSRKPVRITKAATALIAAQLAARERKAQERFAKTKSERKRRAKLLRRRWLGKPRKVRKEYRADGERKPRRVYGNTYWNHSHDI